ncbi:MAG TPA: hypothetical protein VHG93_24825 [Longimicrobium sp.]|nr:hypothetical protein [Longimicrobium sp.]
MMCKAMWPMAALLLAGTALAARPDASDACQTRRALSVRAPLFLMATARADTVRAGRGPIEYNVGDTTRLERIHGQRFRLDSVGGDEAAGLDAGAGTEAVLVPYGWECGETWRWHEARWATPDSQVFADAELWPREMWVDGMPTFSVELVHDVYPENYTDYLESDTVVMLSPAQVFAIHQVLPTSRQAGAPDSAYAPLLAWARANPALAARFPATVMLEEAFEALQPCTHGYDTHPVAGTYRVTVIVERADTLHTYFRTSARGYAQCGRAPPMQVAAMRPRLADTSRLYVHGGPDPDAIPETNREAWNGTTGCSVSTMDVVNHARIEAGRRAWRGDYNYLALPRCFPADPRVKQAADALFEAYRAGEKDPQPGWFRETADGGMRFEQVLRANGRVVLELRAERVGTRTLAVYRGSGA